MDKLDELKERLTNNEILRKYKSVFKLRSQRIEDISVFFNRLEDALRMIDSGKKIKSKFNEIVANPRKIKRYLFRICILLYLRREGVLDDKKFENSIKEIIWHKEPAESGSDKGEIEMVRNIIDEKSKKIRDIRPCFDFLDHLEEVSDGDILEKQNSLLEEYISHCRKDIEKTLKLRRRYNIKNIILRLKAENKAKKDIIDVKIKLIEINYILNSSKIVEKIENEEQCTDNKNCREWLDIIGKIKEDCSTEHEQAQEIQKILYEIEDVCTNSTKKNITKDKAKRIHKIIHLEAIKAVLKKPVKESLEEIYNSVNSKWKTVAARLNREFNVIAEDISDLELVPENAEKLRAANSRLRKISDRLYSDFRDSIYHSMPVELSETISGNPFLKIYLEDILDNLKDDLKAEFSIGLKLEETKKFAAKELEEWEKLINEYIKTSLKCKNNECELSFKGINFSSRDDFKKDLKRRFRELRKNCKKCENYKSGKRGLVKIRKILAAVYNIKYETRHSRDYGEILDNIYEIYPLIIDTGSLKNDAAARKFYRTAKIVADIAAARDAAGVQEVLEVAAEPVSGYLVKRTTTRTVSLNAYLGGAFSRYRISDPSWDYGKTCHASLFCPVGIDIAFGRSCGESDHSWGFFLSAINLGNYFLESDDEAYDFTRIFYPGLFFVWGIGYGDFPLSLGAGICYSQEYNTEKKNAQAVLFFSVDVPIFTVYNR